MYDYRDLQIFHDHGDERVAFHREPHDPAELDPERSWQKHGVVFKCDRCEEKVRVLPVDELEQATTRG